MASQRTNYLKLVLSDDLTSESRSNLLKLDALAANFVQSLNGNFRVRGPQDIVIEPNAADLDGSGTGGSVSIGTATHDVDLYLYLSSLHIDAPLDLHSREPLRFWDTDDSNWVALRAPATVPSNITWNLPSADGTSSQSLVTDGAGNLGWASNLTSALAQHYVEIGNASGVRTPTDTSAAGDVLATSGTGFILKNSGATAGAYGDSTHFTNFTVDTKGRITTASSVALPPPSGAAGGDLSGTYPNPSIANGAVGSAKLALDLVLSGSTSDSLAYALKVRNLALSDIFTVRNDGISTFHQATTGLACLIADTATGTGADAQLVISVNGSTKSFFGNQGHLAIGVANGANTNQMLEVAADNGTYAANFIGAADGSATAAVFQSSNAGSVIELWSVPSGNHIGLQVDPATVNWNLTLPTTHGTADQVLTTDGTGVTSWAAVASTLQGTYNGGPTVEIADGVPVILQETGSQTNAGLLQLNALAGSTGNVLTIQGDVNNWSLFTYNQNASCVGGGILVNQQGLAGNYQGGVVVQMLSGGMDGAQINLASASTGRNLVLAYDDGGFHAVGISVSKTAFISYDLILPDAQGATGTFLQNSDGAGTLTWAGVVGTGAKSSATDSGYYGQFSTDGTDLFICTVAGAGGAATWMKTTLAAAP